MSAGREDSRDRKNRIALNNLGLPIEASYMGPYQADGAGSLPEMELFDVSGRVVALTVSEEQICVTWVSSSR